MTIPEQVRRQGEAADAAMKPQEPEATGSPEAPSQQQQPTENWEHKYKTLQGILSKEQADSKRTVDYLTDQLMQTKAAFQELQQAVEANTQAQASQANVLPDDVIKALEDEGIGKEAIDGILKAVNSAAAGAAQPLAQEVKKMQQDSQKTHEDLFFDRLDARVPDWESVNATPEFVQWLSQAIPGTGFTRKQILDDARARLDAKRAIEIFTAYKAEPGSQGNRPPEPPIETVPHHNPGRPISVGSDKTYTKAEINQFYKDVATGRYTPEQAAQMDAEITQACFERRVEGSDKGFQFKTAAGPIQPGISPGGPQ